MASLENVPGKMLAWQLYGAGFEKFGKDEKPAELPVPSIKDDELLVKIDAIGLCFSDVKLIKAGESHPRVYTKDLSKEPLIPGHEAVMTVVKVGSKLGGRFKSGERYIIQADIYFKGVNWAYGYALDGGMAQYSVINEKVLNGDEGCYLLPIDDTTPSAIAALFEPWTCVLASYMIDHRVAPKDGGRLLVACEAQGSYVPGRLLEKAKPSEVHLLGVSPAFEAALKKAMPGAQFKSLAAAPSEEAYDDIFICGIKSKALGEALAKLGAVNAIVSFVAPQSEESWQFDVGSIHYKGWFYQGTASSDLSACYGRNVRSKLKKGGSCWLPGGAGAMGQMHTQLAVEDENGPAKVIVTDMDNARLEHVRRLLEPAAKKRGIEFKLLNPTSFKSPADFEAELSAFAPGGFDDIVMLVPVPAVLSASAKLLKEDGLMNIFAGIPAGKEASLNFKDIALRGARFIGSSGSRTEHLRQTVALVEQGKLNPASALAAIGGMMELKNGLDAVANAKFPGKTVIFPNCVNMPLTTIDKVPELVPGLAGTFSKDGFYTKSTEEALLAKFSS